MNILMEDFFRQQEELLNAQWSDILRMHELNMRFAGFIAQMDTNNEHEEERQAVISIATIHAQSMIEIDLWRQAWTFATDRYARAGDIMSRYEEEYQRLAQDEERNEYLENHWILQEVRSVLEGGV